MEKIFATTVPPFPTNDSSVCYDLGWPQWCQYGKSFCLGYSSHFAGVSEDRPAFYEHLNPGALKIGKYL